MGLNTDVFNKYLYIYYGIKQKIIKLIINFIIIFYCLKI